MHFKFTDVFVVYGADGARIVRQMGAVFGSQPSVQVQEGQQFNVTCSATGRDGLTVQWFRYGRAVDDVGRVRQNGGVLRFDRVENGDGGGYTCIAKDGAGQDEESIDLIFGREISLIHCVVTDCLLLKCLLFRQRDHVFRALAKLPRSGLYHHPI